MLLDTCLERNGGHCPLTGSFRDACRLKPPVYAAISCGEAGWVERSLSMDEMEASPACFPRDAVEPVHRSSWP